MSKRSCAAVFGDISAQEPYPITPTIPVVKERRVSKVRRGWAWVQRMFTKYDEVYITLLVLDFAMHVIMSMLHVTGHAYPTIRSVNLDYVIKAITVYSPWEVFHLVIAALYVLSAFLKNSRLTSLVVTLSWTVWVWWTILMSMWVVTAPVNWMPAVAGIPLIVLTWLARRIWVAKGD